MALFSKRSSHPALSRLDGMAANWSDFLLLVGRILIGWLFLASGYAKLTNIAGATGYFNSLGMTPPDMWAWSVGCVELVLGVALILGIATRYAALAGFLFVVVATAIAHRYWAYPAAAQGAQFNNFIRNLAIMGGTIYAFVYGAGSISADAKLAK
jgi:putative oxidoreductase